MPKPTAGRTNVRSVPLSGPTTDLYKYSIQILYHLFTWYHIM